MDYVRLVLAIVGALGSFIAWLREKQMIDAAEAEVIDKALQGQSDEIHKAVTARETVADDLRQHPDHVLRRDEFSRD